LAPGGDGAVERLRGQVFQGRRLAAGQPAGAQGFIGRLQDGCGVEPFAFTVEGADPAPDRGGGFAVELLIGDRFSQGIERPNEFISRDVEAPTPCDQGSKPGITFGQMIDRLFHRAFEQQIGLPHKSVLWRRPNQLRSLPMTRSTRFQVCAAALLLASIVASMGQEAVVRRVDAVADKTATAVSLDIIELESSYVFESDLHRSGSFGEQSAVQNSFGYAHRFLLSGHLYLHLGIEYERFDFSATGAPVPDHLQSVAGVIGIDYMHNDDVGAFIQIKPGIYTQNDFDSAAFDVPITLGRIFVLQEDHLYFFAGANAAFLRGRFPVIPLAGLIWMPNEQWKVLGILPEPRVIYSPNDKWDFWVGGELTGGLFEPTATTRLSRQN
jgi:hypothetical protein